MMIEEARVLRDAFGTFMTGVTVVTTYDGAGKPLGFTANSFSSVSLDPPLLLVSIAKSSQNFAAFSAAGGFAINVLSEAQKAVSNTFARPVADRFATVGWANGPFGSPVLAEVSAWFDCSMHQTVDAGDHAILIGRVEAFEASQSPGLGYYRGSYFTPARTGVAVATGPDVVISAVIEAAGEVLLVDDGAGGLTLPTARVGPAGAQAALSDLIGALGVQASPGFIYAVYEDVGRRHQHIAFLCPAAPGTPRRGGFVELTPAGVEDVTDPAMRRMLERLADESRVGSYGIYFGNQDQGRVEPIGERKQT
ncbi:MAG: flavin reductase [Rhodobacterales bacterium 32-67-9]|nr:MAG: flavin reductase [Rhodobacterales bacterium 32-67-9]